MPVSEAWIDTVYRCATGDAPWEDALRPIMQDTNTFCIGAVNHTIMPLKANVCINVDGPPNLTSTYEQTFVHANPLMDALSAMTPGTFLTGLSEREGGHHEGTKFFKEYLAPQNVGDTMWISLARRPGEFFMLAAPRMPQAGVFTKADLDILQPYIPHLTRAFDVWLKLNLYKAENEWVTAALDQVSNGMITLGPQRTIYYANRAAEGFLASMKGAQRQMLKLRFADAALDAQFQAILDQSSHLIGEKGDNILILHRGQSLAPLLLRVEPLAAPKDDGIIPSPVAIIHIIDPDARSLAGVPVFARSAGLTSAEARFLEKLVQFGSVVDASEKAGIAESTARSHVKSIYTKMGTKTIGQLLLKVYKATLG